MNEFVPPEGFVEGDFLGDYRSSRKAKRRAKYRHHRRHEFEPIPFLDLPRVKRRDKAASLNWRIRSDPNGRGVFTTHEILPGSREWPLLDAQGHRNISLWASFLFMSQAPLREGRFFNATAHSVLYKAFEQLEDQAEAAVLTRVPDTEKALLERRHFFQDHPDGSVSMVSAPASGLPSLGGLTRAGAQAAWLRERWDDLEDLVHIQPGVALDFSYGHGIGVSFVVDQPWVDTETIPGIVEQFRQRGEQEYTEQAVDLKKYAQPLRELMETLLWRWDHEQADAEGAPAPEASDAVRRLYHFKSQAIRFP